MLLFIVLGLVAVFGLAQEIVEEIVAIINDEVITLSQYKREYETRIQAIQAEFQQAKGQISREDLDKALAQLKTQLLDSMITDRLLLQLARERNLNVSEQVKMAIENIKKENNLESDEDLKRALQSQGFEWETWLKQMEETILRQAIVVQEVNRLIVLDDAEVVDYYKKHQPEFIEPEEYIIRAVYLNAVDADAAALEAKKREIDDKIKSGADFTETSGTYSDDPLKESKGDLGTVKKGTLDKIIQQALEKLKKGEISPWVQAKAGWYLLKMEDKKESRLLAFEEAKKGIEEKLYGQKQDAKLNEFLGTIKNKSYIKILKPNPLGTDK
jgi:parvulin-like peptidyl-prolyl isomerase